MFKSITHEIAKTYGPSPSSPTCIDLGYAAEEICSPHQHSTIYLNSNELKQCLC